MSLLFTKQICTGHLLEALGTEVTASDWGRRNLKANKNEHSRYTGTRVGSVFIVNPTQPRATWGEGAWFEELLDQIGLRPCLLETVMATGVGGSRALQAALSRGRGSQLCED